MSVTAWKFMKLRVGSWHNEGVSFLKKQVKMGHWGGFQGRRSLQSQTEPGMAVVVFVFKEVEEDEHRTVCMA